MRNFVAAEVQKRFGIQKHLINFVGPTIGAHSGPGTVALFFLGKNGRPSAKAFQSAGLNILRFFFHFFHPDEGPFLRHTSF